MSLVYFSEDILPMNLESESDCLAQTRPCEVHLSGLTVSTLPKEGLPHIAQPCPASVRCGALRATTRLSIFVSN